MMQFNLRESADLKWYEYKYINNDDSIYLLFTTRNGGMSSNPYTSLNMATHVGDDKQTVLNNRNIILEKYGMNNKYCVSANQTHGDKIEYVTKDDLGKGSIFDPINNADGLITDDYDVVLMSFYADCVPIYYFDKTKKIIGIAHAGWRGTTLDIAAKMLDRFCKKYNSNINDLRVVIGPAICKKCFEIDDTVINEFKKVFNSKEIEEISSKQVNGRYLLDLWKANELLLLRKGVSNNQIHVMSLCTYCEEELFFSYRRENGQTGRMASLIFKNSKESK
jgi:YfiH family protein